MKREGKRERERERERGKCGESIYLHSKYVFQFMHKKLLFTAGSESHSDFETKNCPWGVFVLCVGCCWAECERVIYSANTQNPFYLTPLWWPLFCHNMRFVLFYSFRKKRSRILIYSNNNSLTLLTF